MTWVRFDDQFPGHRKVGPLSDGAFRLHVEAICWCARHLTDGVVSRSDLAQIARARKPERLVIELVRLGTWREAPNGWEIHDYLDYQPSRAQVMQDRKAKAERQARWLAKKRAHGPPSIVDASSDGSIDASKDDAPPRPAPKGAGTGSPQRPPAADGGWAAAGVEQENQPPRCRTCGNTLDSSYHRRVCRDAAA